MKKGPLQEIDSKNQMAIDERGIVGNWKGYQVYILEKKEYVDNQHIPEGYFDRFAGEVIEFFKHLNKELYCWN